MTVRRTRVRRQAPSSKPQYVKEPPASRRAAAKADGTPPPGPPNTPNIYTRMETASDFFAFLAACRPPAHALQLAILPPSSSLFAVPLSPPPFRTGRRPAILQPEVAGPARTLGITLLCRNLATTSSDRILTISPRRPNAFPLPALSRHSAADGRGQGEISPNQFAH
jgi:hypothetical protein